MTSILTALYSQIAVLELLESISRCGNVWNGHDNNTFTATIKMQRGIYDFYISSHPETNNYILDVILNGTYYTSISSSDQPQIADLYSEIVDSMDYSKQRSLAADLSALKKCPLANDKIPIIASVGSFGGGGQGSIYIIYQLITTGRGAKANGGSFRTNNEVSSLDGPTLGVPADSDTSIISAIYDVTNYTPDGPLANSYAEIDTVDIISSLDGPFAGGSANDLDANYDATNYTPNGPLASGSAILV